MVHEHHTRVRYADRPIPIQLNGGQTLSRHPRTDQRLDRRPGFRQSDSGRSSRSSSHKEVERVSKRSADSEYRPMTVMPEYHRAPSHGGSKSRATPVAAAEKSEAKTRATVINKESIDKMMRVLGDPSAMRALLSMAHYGLKYILAHQNSVVGRFKDPRGVFNAPEFSSIFSDYRNFATLVDLFSVYKAAKAQRATAKSPNKDKLDTAFAWAQIALGFSSSGVKAFAYICSKNAINLSRNVARHAARTDKWWLASGQLWMVLLLVNYAAMAKEIMDEKKREKKRRLDGVTLTPEEEAAAKKRRNKRRRKLFINTICMPIAYDYSVSKSGLSKKWTSLSNVIASGTKLGGMHMDMK